MLKKSHEIEISAEMHPNVNAKFNIRQRLYASAFFKSEHTHNPVGLQNNKWWESNSMINMKKTQKCMIKRNINSLKTFEFGPKTDPMVKVLLYLLSLFLPCFGLQGSCNGESSKLKEILLTKSKTAKNINVSFQLLCWWNTGYKCSILTTHRVIWITQRNWWSASYNRALASKC